VIAHERLGKPHVLLGETPHLCVHRSDAVSGRRDCWIFVKSPMPSMGREHGVCGIHDGEDRAADIEGPAFHCARRSATRALSSSLCGMPCVTPDRRL
jgi:hypothetical protein